MAAHPLQTIDGTPGNKVNANGLQTALQAALDQVYAFPVYTTIAGNGSNAEYTITGFIQLKICAAGGQTGACYDNTKPVGGDDVQVRYVAYVPVGQINTLCGIGGVSCPAFNSYVTSLDQIGVSQLAVCSGTDPGTLPAKVSGSVHCQ